MGAGARAGLAALALAASLLVVPVVGGVTQLVELRGDTPMQAATGPTRQVEYLGTVGITASDATRGGIYARVPVGGISEILAVPTDPVPTDPGTTGRHREPSDTLLVLERGYTEGSGNSAVIWRTTLTGTGILTRELVADLGALIGHTAVGNAEAMAWAPDQPDQLGQPGRPTELLIATDDNFGDGQRGVLHRVRVR